VGGSVRQIICRTLKGSVSQEGASPVGVLGVLKWVPPSERPRTRPISAYVGRASACDERVRACSRLYADHRPPPALAATPAAAVLGVPPAAATAQPVAMCGSAAERPTHRTRRRPAPSRQAMAAAQPTPVMRGRRAAGGRLQRL
jgi:hypothetical protein